MQKDNNLSIDDGRKKFTKIKRYMDFMHLLGLVFILNTLFEINVKAQCYPNSQSLRNSWIQPMTIAEGHGVSIVRAQDTSVSGEAALAIQSLDTFSNEQCSFISVFVVSNNEKEAAWNKILSRVDKLDLHFVPNSQYLLVSWYLAPENQHCAPQSDFRGPNPSSKLHCEKFNLVSDQFTLDHADAVTQSSSCQGTHCSFGPTGFLSTDCSLHESCTAPFRDNTPLKLGSRTIMMLNSHTGIQIGQEFEYKTAEPLQQLSFTFLQSGPNTQVTINGSEYGIGTSINLLWDGSKFESAESQSFSNDISDSQKTTKMAQLRNDTNYDTKFDMHLTLETRDSMPCQNQHEFSNIRQYARRLQALDPPTLDDVEPIDVESADDWYNGTTIDPVTDFIWYVPKRFYMLEKVTFYMDWRKITGFELTYNPHPNLSGWTPETQLFGDDSAIAQKKEITLDQEIVGLEICIDDSSPYTSYSWDFEGFRFHFPDGTSQEISRTGICKTADWETVTFDKERLIGFSVQISEEKWAYYETVRSIKPIFDAPDCSDTTFDSSAIPSTFSIDIGDGEKSLTIEFPDTISQMYGSMDGTSWIGARTYQLTDEPSWLRIEGDQLIITSNSMFDFTETVDNVIIQAIISDSCSATTTLSVSRTCPDEWTCNDGSESQTDLNDVTYEEQECIEGTILENSDEQIWYIEKQNYRLSKVEIYSNEFWTSGFKLTYTCTLPDPTGWNDIIHLVGTDSQTSHQESIDFSTDLTSIQICVRFGHSNVRCHDVQSFKFTESDGTEHQIGPQCYGEYQEYDLSTKTLVGFKYTVSDAQVSGNRNVRTICPLTEDIEVECCDTMIQIEDVAAMLHETGSGSHTQEIVAKNTIFTGAEWSECGELEFSLENAPDYLTLSGTTLTVTSDSLSDTEDLSIVTLKVSLADYPCVEETVDFQVSLSCPTDQICDLSGPFTPETLAEVGCDGSDPLTLTGFSGIVGDNPETDDWYIEYGNYMLVKIQFYGDEQVTSGFEAFYEPYPPSKFSGWPQLYHLYGSKDLGLGQEITLTKDVVSLNFCGESTGADGFEGIRLLEFGETVNKELNTDCASWSSDIAITQQRLIGFEVTTSDYDYDGMTITNIRSISPIVDCLECSNTECIFDNVANLRMLIGTGSDQLILVVPDTISQYYGNFDGQSFCGARTYSIEGTDASWLNENSGVITISSTNPEDPEDIAFPTLKVTLDDYSSFSCETTFTAELYCESGFPCDGDTDLGEDIVTPTSPQTIPECNPDNNYQGTVQGGGEQTVWAVPYQFYQLTSIKVYRTDTITTGFEVTFEAPPEFENWPVYTKLFGFDSLRRRLEDGTEIRNLQSTEVDEISLEADVAELQLCVDDDDETEEGDFHGFRCIQFGSEDQQEAASQCKEDSWKTVTLDGERIVGFKVVTSEYKDGIKNIRGICPLLDKPDCAQTECVEGQPLDMKIVIGSGTEKQTLAVEDTYSKYYFGEDSGNYCGEKSYRVYNTSPWITYDETTNEIILTSNDPNDQPELVYPTVEVTRVGDSEPLLVLCNFEYKIQQKFQFFLYNA